MIERETLLTIKEASVWATKHIGKDVTPSNITYLLNYGRILKAAENGATRIPVQELINYYETHNREAVYKKKLGGDLNWDLAFENYKESETTKHVHRFRPYRGKFIPQLVEYFLDSHTDNFKTETL